MKINETKNTIIRTEDFEESFFGIDNNEDMAHIFNILRSKIYSDKILAVIREYSTNAQDAHVLAGTPDRPITVKLPTNYSPYFTVRDFGPGLSEEAVRSVYVKYGKSTKRDSNDYNGQLGLGCKAGFAYGDSFLISSFQNGIRKDFECYIDETKIGKINKLQEVETAEENGILISIPVKNMDISAFLSTANKFYEYFNPLPECTGLKEIKEREGLLGSGKEWKLYSYSRYNDPFGAYNIQALMGNVRYPIDSAILRKSVPFKYWNAQIESIVSTDLALLMNFKIGDLSISSSRESLEYDQQTLKKIIEKIQYCYDELIANIEKEIVDIKDIFHAKMLWYKVNYSDLSSIFRNSKNGIVFNGQQITSSSFDYDNSKKYDYANQVYHPNKYSFDVHSYSPLRKSFRPAHTMVENFSAASVSSKETIFMLNDADKQTRRIKTVFEKHPNVKTFILLTPYLDNTINPTGKSVEDWFDSEMIPREYLKKLSDYEPIKNKSRVGPVEDKHSAKVFLFDETYVVTTGKYSAINAWSISDLDIKTASEYYVPIDRFLIKGQEPYLLHELIYNLEELSFFIDVEVYGIKQRLVESLGPNMKNFFDEVKRLLELKMEDPVFSEMFSASTMNRYLSKNPCGAFAYLIRANKDITLNDYLDLTDPRLQFLALGVEAAKFDPINKDFLLMQKILSSSFFSGEQDKLESTYQNKISKAYEIIQESFPLLQHTVPDYWYNTTENHIELSAIINYIQIKSKSDIEIINFQKEKEENDKQERGEEVSASNGTEG